MAKSISHKITTTEKLTIKGASFTDDFKLVVDGENKALDELLKAFVGKVIDLSITEKTEEEIELESESDDSFDDFNFDGE